MPARQRRRRRSSELTPAQQWDLQLDASPVTPRPADIRSKPWHPRPFVTEEERREAWAASRDELMYRGNPGTRPAAFWGIEHPEVDIDEVDEAAWLDAQGLLADAERAELLALGELDGSDDEDDDNQGETSAY